MLIAFRHGDNPSKYTVEDVNITYQPEKLILYNPQFPEPSFQNGMEIAGQVAYKAYVFWHTYSGLLHEGRRIPIYEQRISKGPNS